MKSLSLLALCAAAAFSQDTTWTIPLPGTATVITPTLSTSNTSWDALNGSVHYSRNGGALDIKAASAERRFVGPIPTLQQIRLDAKPIPEALLAPTEYLKLAFKVGLQSAATDEVRLLEAIYSLGLKTHDFAKVDEYLYRKALDDKAINDKATTRWAWKPLRESDQKVTNDAINLAAWRRPAVVSNNMGQLSFDLYARTIPARVLENIASVLARLPDAVFVVSDYEAVKPDPFLAVSTRKLLVEGKLWIIDVWAEPGFSDIVIFTVAPLL